MPFKYIEIVIFVCLILRNLARLVAENRRYCFKSELFCKSLLQSYFHLGNCARLGFIIAMSKTNTRFYRHYKNKPYKLIGTVRHSETLEELTYYESLYDNQHGRMWVRPKDMFFEDVVVDGVKRPRFEKIEFKYIELSALDVKQMREVAGIYEIVFEQAMDQKKVDAVIAAHTVMNYLLAYDGDKLIGFKMGFARDNERFYSWSGGVLPEYQNLGVATSLMNLQHDWCKQKGFKKIETRTLNKFVDMLRLNLKFGFQIAGTVSSSGDKLKIVMEKLV